MSNNSKQCVSYTQRYLQSILQRAASVDEVCCEITGPKNIYNTQKNRYDDDKDRD